MKLFLAYSLWKIGAEYLSSTLGAKGGASAEIFRVWPSVSPGQPCGGRPSSALFACVFVFACVFAVVCLVDWLIACVSVRLCVCCVCVCLFVMCLCGRLFVLLFVYLFVCLFVRLFAIRYVSSRVCRV